ncbi:MAG: FAD:protein FMN transferase, partial [Vicingaceae bacterium]
MKKLSWIGVLVFLMACQPEPKISRKQVAFGGEAQGTTYTVKYISDEIKTLPQQMDSLLKAIDASMSTYLESSTIVRLNEGDSAVVDEMFVEVFELSQRMNRETDGAFDPTLAPVIEAWGFDYSQPQKMDSAKVDSLLAFCGFEQFELNGKVLRKKNRGAKLNFNAVAQGYSVDLMAELLRAKNINDFYVELGGEVIAGGLNQDSVPWRIGIDKPQGRNLERELSAIVSIEDQAMVTSGNYRKSQEVDARKYSHSIDQKTGIPLKYNL